MKHRVHAIGQRLAQEDGIGYVAGMLLDAWVATLWVASVVKPLVEQDQALKWLTQRRILSQQPPHEVAPDKATCPGD